MSDADWIRVLADQRRGEQPHLGRAASSNGRRPAIEVIITRSADVRAEHVTWLIDGRVPLDAITGVGGEPGLGKSALTALYAAEGSRGLHGGPWGTLFVSAEDSASRVIKPRLLALQADHDRIGYVAVRDAHGLRVPTLPDHLPDLRTKIEDDGAKLLVLDPLNAFLSGDVDSHKDQSIRRVLAPLAQLAEELHIAIIVVLHTRKQTGGPAVYRLGGSVGYGGAARSVLGFGRDPEDPDGERGHHRVLGHIKNNWGPLAGTLVYRHEAVTVLEGDEMIDTHKLVLVGESDLDPSAAFDAPKRDDRGEDVEEAILEALANGPRKSRDVKTAVAGELDVAAKTVERRAVRLAEAGEIEIREVGRTTTWALIGDARPLTQSPVPNSGENPVVEPNELGTGDWGRGVPNAVPNSGDGVERREPTCQHPEHRHSDWAMPAGVVWICGACHPPAPGVHVVYRHPREDRP